VTCKPFSPVGSTSTKARIYYYNNVRLPPPPTPPLAMRFQSSRTRLHKNSH
jgi:hypothetical protein